MEIIVLPVVSLPDTVMLPDLEEHFGGSEAKITEAVNVCEVLYDHGLFVTAGSGVSAIGTVGKIRNTLRVDKQIKTLFSGEKRGRISKILRTGPFVLAEIEILDYTNADTALSAAGVSYVRELVPTLFSLMQFGVPLDVKDAIRKAKEPNTLVNLLAPLLETLDRKKLLEESDTEQRLHYAGVSLKEQIRILEIKKDFSRRVERNMRGIERDAVIRSQIRSLEEQLSDGDNGLKARIEALNCPDEAKAKLNKELAKYEKLPPNAQEAGIIESYLDFALSLPWKEKSVDTLDLKRAKAVLDEDHYGLDEVKDRILEYLAVRILSPEAGKSTILCLVGPPGVGKTSIAKSVARALDKKYVKMSLGGVRDESEIRGHRKTYLGAMPGRVLSNIAASGVSNPLFLLDEIDKLVNDATHGDPSSAMLEVLDPAQNSNFRDNYLEMAYDLSDVMFLATANYLSGIPRPLLDRMEIIEMSGYTEEEKLNIAKRYLIKKQCAASGLAEDKLAFTDEAILRIIGSYTRESGVRELERKLGSIARKCARKFVEEGNLECVVVGEENAEYYLGKPRYKNLAAIPNEVGAATGLAWTSVGGEVMKIEVSLIKGKGGLILTGKLGEVMQESAKTALSYIRANADKYGVNAAVFEENDVHIHVPEGATPKDGPSAGVTIATAVISALTGKTVKNAVAMTGEITLHGNVLPIGGLKEKTLAAVRNGLDTVIVPKDNLPDAEETGCDVNFVFVEKVDEVFAAAFDGFSRAVN